MQRLQQMAKPSRSGVEATGNRRFILDGGQLGHHFLVQVARFHEIAAAEVEPHYWVAYGPVPAAVNVEPYEQRLVALEQFLQRVQQEALAKTPRARQEVVLAFVRQPP